MMLKNKQAACVIDFPDRPSPFYGDVTLQLKNHQNLSPDIGGVHLFTSRRWAGLITAKP